MEKPQRKAGKILLALKKHSSLTADQENMAEKIQWEKPTVREYISVFS